jgi:arylsulfatase A-like enzyme
MAMTADVRNVVVVVVDALRRDRVGTYHDGETLTPNIDALASEGTVFDDAVTCTNATDPSVTAMHTGRDPETVVKHHGPFVTDAEKRRAESVPTVPERLQEQGVTTAVTGRTLGRWHSRGFEHYPEPSLDRYRRRAIGEALGAVSPRLRSLAGSVYERVSSLRSSESTDEIDALLGALDDRPFYGFVHLMETHVPYDYDQAVVSDLLDRREYPDEGFAEFLEEHADNPYVDETMREYAEEADYRVGLARWFAKYDAAAVAADRKVGKLVDALDERDRLSETAVVVLSDHGESLDEHGIFFEHHGLYEPQVRIPLVVGGPAIPAQRRTELVQPHDLAPTILDLVAGESFSCAGRSLVPFLEAEEGWSRDHVIVQEAHAQRRVGLRTDRYKYLKHVPDEVLERERGDSFRCGYCETVHGDDRELYDLRADPEERENLVADRPEVAADLDARLTSHFDGLEYPDGEEADADRVEYDDEAAVLDRLEDLGYR